MTLHAHLDPADAATGLRLVREIIAVPDGFTLGEDFGSPDLAAACVPCGEVAVGMAYDPAKATFGPAPARAPDVPEEIFDYQLAGQAEVEGIISTKECDAWTGPGTIPPSIVAAVQKVVTDPGEQRKLMLFLKGSKVFPRHHPRTPLLGALFGKDTDAKLDAFFVAARER